MQDPQRSEMLASCTRGLLGNSLSFLLLVGLEISPGVQSLLVPAPAGVRSCAPKIQQQNLQSPISHVFVPCSWAHLVRDKRQLGSPPTGSLAWILQGLIGRLSSPRPVMASRVSPHCSVP